ncbi:MAG: hypothetical protein ACFFBP_20160 [Promethearchaeota archaeon]
MPSYKMFRIHDSKKLNSFLSNNWMNSLKTPSGLSESVRRKFNQIKSNIKESELISNENGKKYIMKCKYKMEFETSEIWISISLEMIINRDLIIIQQQQTGINFLIETSLYDILIPISFPNKDLYNLWTFFRQKMDTEGKSIHLHRLIIENVNFYKDKISEMNISSNDISEIESFNDLIEDSQKIKVITLKLSGLTKKKKNFTVRIAQNQFQIYGTHSIDTVSKFIDYFNTYLK